MLISALMATNIKDVALKAGVSISTVSKVISGNYKISEETQSRVKKTMKDLNYYPNRLARSFVMQSSEVIGVFLDLNRLDAFEKPHLYEILAGVQGEVRGKGFMVNLLESESLSRKGNLVRLIREKRMDGMIIHVNNLTPDLISILEVEKFPYISIGAPHPEIRSVSWIDFDNSETGRQAADFLKVQGFIRPCFLGGAEEDFIASLRAESCRQVFPDAIILKGHYSVDAG